MAWNKKKFQEAFYKDLKKKLSISDILAKLLSCRFDSMEDVEKILKGSLKDVFPDPKSLIDMEAAVAKIKQCIEKNDKLVIFGDYDVDGITSCSILYLFLKSINYENISVYLPKRLDEGYGPNLNAFKRFVNDGVKLCITLDCGSSSFEEIDFALTNDMDVIVVDHHKAYEIPKNCCVINPSRFDEEFKFKELAAVGVTFLFILAINESLNKPIDSLGISKYLPFVALGTVCDQVPIGHLNRIMVKKGIEILNKCLNKKIRGFKGFKILIDAVLPYHIGEYNLKENDLSYRLGPVINAGGRVGNEPILGFRLLCEFKGLSTLIDRLLTMNKERSFIESDILESAICKAKNVLQIYKSSIVIFSEDWHLGIIGIVASKVKEKFMLPTFIIAKDKAILKGSARSIKGVDLKVIIEQAKEARIIECGGGHEMAAGFSLQKDQLNEFARFVDDKCSSFVKDISNRTVLEYDMEIFCDQFNKSLYDTFRILAPFGNSNPEPLIFIKGVKIISPRLVKNKHLFFCFKQDCCNNAVSAIMFSACNYDIDLEDINSDCLFDLVGCIDISHYRGEEEVKFFVIDIRNSE